MALDNPILWLAIGLVLNEAITLIIYLENRRLRNRLNNRHIVSRYRE